MLASSASSKTILNRTPPTMPSVVLADIMLINAVALLLGSWRMVVKLRPLTAARSSSALCMVSSESSFARRSISDLPPVSTTLSRSRLREVCHGSKTCNSCERLFCAIASPIAAVSTTERALSSSISTRWLKFCST